MKKTNDTLRSQSSNVIDSPITPKREYLQINRDTNNCTKSTIIPNQFLEQEFESLKENQNSPYNPS